MNSNDEEQLVDAVLDAVDAGHPERARLLLHPYLHWTTPGGTTYRGRTKVLALLSGSETPLARPQAVELRDEQIYRWTL